MKAKFVLAVLFLGHFIVTNDGGEISDTQSECQGANCVELGASVNRRSVDGVGEKGLRSFTVKKKKGLRSFTLKKKKGFHSFTLKKKKLTNRKLCPKKNSPINVVNRIHKGAHKKVTYWLKSFSSPANKKAAEIKAEIQKIYNGMDHSRKQKVKDMFASEGSLIEDHYSTVASILTNRKLHRKSYSLINIENRIHKAAHKKINRLLKTASSQRKALSRQVKNGVASISHLVKISCEELNAEKDKLNARRKIIISSFDEEMRFLNSSVKDLRKTIDNVAENIKELIDKFWNEARDVERCNINTVCQGRGRMEDLKHLIRQAAFCSSNHIKDLLNCGDFTIRGLASTSGHGAMELSTKNCAKFQSIPSNNNDEGLQTRNMNIMCERLTQLSQLIADKLHYIAESCLEFLSKLTENGIKALNRLAAKLSELADAECEGNDKRKAEIQDAIEQIYHDMDHSRKEIYKNMFNNELGLIEQLFGHAATIIPNMINCTLDKTC